MRKLIAKVMSDEVMPDGDKRKCFDLHVIPENYSISFTRQADGIAAMCLNPDNNKLPSLVIGLPGNVYIMEDGNTISTFMVKPVEAKSVQGIVTNRDGSMVFSDDEYEFEATPEGITIRSKHDTRFTRLGGTEPFDRDTMMPLSQSMRSQRGHHQPDRPLLSSGVAVASAIPAMSVNETEVVVNLNKDLRDLLTLATSDVELPDEIKRAWNKSINYHATLTSSMPAEKRAFILTSNKELGIKQADVNKYITAVNNALLNDKPVLHTLIYKELSGYSGYQLNFVSPVEQVGLTAEALAIAKADLKDLDLSGLVIAAYDRIVKLWRYGANEVYFKTLFVISVNEHSLLNSILNKHFNIAVEFDGKNDRVDMAVITSTK